MHVSFIHKVNTASYSAIEGGPRGTAVRDVHITRP